MSQEKKNNGIQIISDHFKIKTSHYIIAGFGVIAALTWKDTMKTFLDAYFPANGQHLLAQFIYACIITFILILLIVILPDTEPELPKNVRKAIKEKKYIKENYMDLINDDRFKPYFYKKPLVN